MACNRWKWIASSSLPCEKVSRAGRFLCRLCYIQHLQPCQNLRNACDWLPSCGVFFLCRLGERYDMFVRPYPSRDFYRRVKENNLCDPCGYFPVVFSPPSDPRFAPEMELVRHAIEYSQRDVEGAVEVALYKVRIFPFFLWQVSRACPARAHAMTRLYGRQSPCFPPGGRVFLC